MIDSSVFIAPGAHVIGNVKIGPGSSVWFGSVIRADLDCIERSVGDAMFKMDL